MAVHHTPRKVLEVIIRKIDRKQYAPLKSRRRNINYFSSLRIRDPEAYERGKQFNEKHGLSQVAYKKARIKGWNRSVKRKISMPVSKMKDPEE